MSFDDARAAKRVCPHCGKEVESEIPEGWIKVPLTTWNNLVRRAERADAAEDLMDKVKELDKALARAHVKLTAAHRTLEKAMAPAAPAENCR